MITYVKGDATRPQGGGMKLIPHVCNDRGGWGAGFVLALSKLWKEPEAAYRAAYREGKIKLGVTQFIPVGADIIVANMVAQRGYGRGNQNQHRSSEADDLPPIDYDHLEGCLMAVAAYAFARDCSLHMPRIGCGLAGGKWERVEPLIVRAVADIPVTVYDFDQP